MGWQLRRRLLDAVDGDQPGSAWWRAVNERLLRDAAEACAHVLGLGGEVSSASVALSVSFIRRPSARVWYRAHNAAIATAYVEHRALAEAESRVERFFINLVLARVLYAHALVAAPRLALSWLSPVAPLLSDPRLGMTGIFLSLSRVLPARYPLRNDLQWYISEERGLGRLLDLGIIQPRFDALRLVRGRTLHSRNRRPDPGRCARLCLGYRGCRAVEPGTAGRCPNRPTRASAPGGLIGG